MAENKNGGDAGKGSGSGGTGAVRPQSYVTGTVQKDAHGGQRPKGYGTRRVQEGDSGK